MSVKKYLVLTQQEYDFLMEYFENETDATWSHREPPTERNFFEDEPNGLIIYHYVDERSIKYGALKTEKREPGFTFDDLNNVAYMMGGQIDMTPTQPKKDLRFKNFSKEAVNEEEKKDPYNPRDEYNYEFTLFDVLEKRDIVIQVEEDALKTFFKENIANLLN